MSRNILRNLLGLVVVLSILLCGVVPGWSDVPMPGTPAGIPAGVPDYFDTPNWANSPPLRKFVDTLPLLCSDATPTTNNLGQCLSIAQADTTTYPGSDYYEIELGQYTERMHSDLNPTTLRGYRQVNTADTYASSFHFLGPVIVAQKNRPVRVKFINALPTTALGGDLFIPVDTTVMGSGPYEINYDPATKLPSETKTGTFAQNRATLHLHGGRTPWISDGTPHQWITPKGESVDYSKGVSVSYVPDMWFDAAGATITACAGQTTCATPGASNNPGDGMATFYWTNQQSGRLMFYHDHAWGITRLNVYVGEAAGYIITDPTEAALQTAGIIPPFADTIPLVIEDKTFVDEATITTTDPLWQWGTNPGFAHNGDLWWPHVYMPAQNPYNPNMSGINDFGRWHYGPWFYPPTPECGSSANAVKPMCVDFGAESNEYYMNDPNCYPTENDLCTQPPERPGTPNVSWGAEAFLDVMTVNGTAYPKLNVDPKQYRFRILNASHDRFVNLQFYVADALQTNPSCTTCASNTEVKMVSAALTAGFPANWPTDGREGGVPDPGTRGPAWIQIASEGGLLPKPVVLPNQPVRWNMDPTMFNVGNVLQQNAGGGTVFIGPAERADLVVDFSQFAGKTLILYNDAPTAFPALDPHYDYYTGAPDRTDIGGATAIPVGLGPNIRTVMQIVVSGSGGIATPNAYNPATLTSLTTAFTSSTGAFVQGQDPIIVGQTAYNATYGTTFPARSPNWGLSRISDTALNFMKPDGTMVSKHPMLPKAIHDEMGASFDDYGRMSAKLGLEVPFVNASIANFVLQNFVDPPTEIVNPNKIQIWKITHNGVDTHPIHFHLFDVQLINRVGWDGFIRVPDENELGWKDTIRISPLEDTIVALKPVIPQVPFTLPESIRPLNPEAPLGSTMGFSNIDVLTGGPMATATTNQMYNYGFEYVWHCHILSHEENDMMRTIVFKVKDHIGVFSSGAWYLDQSGNDAWDGTPSDINSSFNPPAPGATPIAGDWNGNGTSKVGMYKDGVWYLDLNGNGVWNGTTVDRQLTFGAGLAGAVPVVGDWNGSGSTKAGVFVAATGYWYLDLNGNGVWDGTPTDVLYTFGSGLTGAVPVTGDWNGSGTTKVGVLVPATGQWFLDLNGNGVWDGTPTDSLAFFGAGLTGTVPVTGDWSGSGSTKVGLFESTTGQWYLDLNGNGVWDGAPTDSLAYFGQGLTGIMPVAGKW